MHAEQLGQSQETLPSETKTPERQTEVLSDFQFVEQIRDEFRTRLASYPMEVLNNLAETEDLKSAREVRNLLDALTKLGQLHEVLTEFEDVQLEINTVEKFLKSLTESIEDERGVLAQLAEDIRKVEEYLASGGEPRQELRAGLLSWQIGFNLELENMKERQQESQLRLRDLVALKWALETSNERV